MTRSALAFALLVSGFLLVWPVVAQLSASDPCREIGGRYEYNCELSVGPPGIAVWQRHGITILASIALGVAGCVLLFRR
jgi:hypothetical protein